MSRSPRILLLGFGNMGQALARGWVARGYEPGRIAVVDPQARARAAAETLGCRAFPDTAAVELGTFDVVVVAVKPQQLDVSLGPLGSSSGFDKPVFLSIAAGKTSTQVVRALGPGARVVRAMPNTPAAIGQGVTGLFATAAVSAAERSLCGELMTAVGTVEWLAEEALMDVVTALSGSGPAYVFLLVECLAQAGTELGLDAAVAARLATATVAGAGRYALESDEAAAALRRRVTSPGGTTEAALEILLAEGGLPDLLERALAAAARRSRELAGGA